MLHMIIYNSVSDKQLAGRTEMGWGGEWEEGGRTRGAGPNVVGIELRD
jgi:hypothetical protein